MVILPFLSKEATLAHAGGKGANLSELVRAGFPVPPGFIVATSAYRTFVEANRLLPRILALAGSLSPEDLAAFEEASAEICGLFERGTLPEEITRDLRTAYHTLAPSREAVAVRSSATAEDLPGLAFAGQHDTYLNITGDEPLLEAVKRCWGSLWTVRALAYRARNHIPPGEVALAVIVQKMIASAVSGVAFTANPITGRRDEIVIDASYGLGEAVVSGLVDPDRYIVDPKGWRIIERKLGKKELAIVPGMAGGTTPVPGGAGVTQALPDPQIIALAQMARRVATRFGVPQDIEWAWAGQEPADEPLYLLQARPITSLYPLPDRAQEEGELRVYVNFNAIQGVSEPLTPLGMDALRLVFSGVRRLLRIHRAPDRFLPDAGGRLFLDFTDLVADPHLWKAGSALLAGTEPGAQQILCRLIEGGRVPPRRVLGIRRAAGLIASLLPILRRPLAALIRPEAVRPRFSAAAAQYLAGVRQHARSAVDLASLLPALEHDLPEAERISIDIMPSVLPVVSGALPLVERWLMGWLGEPPGAADPLLRGLPGNVTTEMNLALWAVARQIRADPHALETLRSGSVESLVEAYRQGRLPGNAQPALDEFLQAYGMRGMAEIDLGRPRWREDPASILQTLQGYLRLEDPALAPDVLFRQRVLQAERLAQAYTARARKLRFGRLRAALLAGLIRRMRTLGGLREAPLFYLAQVLDIYRAALLGSARQIVARGELAQAADIFFVPLESLKCYSRGEKVDLKSLAAANRAVYERERTRRHMPRVLLSTGEAFYEGIGAAPTGKHDLAGEAVSPGVAEGRVRVVLDPRAARLEPGEILVCPSTDPGWTPLFLTAGGLVMEIGGRLTHGSIVAREYGLPAVVGVHQATTRLRDGQQVRVDGNRGRVTVLE
jgi:pyruvate,water dikinase